MEKYRFSFINIAVNSYSPIKFTPIKKPDDLRDELGRPIVPQNQTSRTLRIFLKRVSLNDSSINGWSRGCRRKKFFFGKNQTIGKQFQNVLPQFF